MIHYMTLNPTPFDKMQKGLKTIELRLYDEKRRKVNEGDQIEFLNSRDKAKKLRVRVIALHRFESFDALYKSLPLELCGYEEGEKASPVDMERYYSPEEQAKYGVCGIEVELVRQNSDMKRTSKYISLLLRHKPEIAGITLDSHGWAKVEDLIGGVSKTMPLTMEMLEQIVDTDKKQRYSFNDDKTLIRANQGHSIDVDVELEQLAPPEKLWHGTGKKYMTSIDEKGLESKSRLYVHLSSDYETAVNVGKRHGKPIVYCVDAAKMSKDGYVFYKSVNNVWLTKFVPAEYLRKETE